MNKLIIVESPGKIKKIKEIVGSGYEIMASVGHICDLPMENGVDKAHGFKLNYVIDPDKKAVVAKLKSSVATVGKNNVLLATDPDREGEAISFHLARVLGLSMGEKNRVTFQEITKAAIQKSLGNPRSLDMNLVCAQEARRAIDRLVGFEISPLLNRKISSNTPLSAGRVQSVAVKLVYEREKEIATFSSTFKYKISGSFLTSKNNVLKAAGKNEFTTLEEAKNYLRSISTKQFAVLSVTKTPKKTLPEPPFSTSTLQQDANRRLKFSVDKTMQLAQKLYEGGHITYMRTDSVNLSDTAISELEQFITSTYGVDYVETRKFKNKNDSAQEAHEAIRPTHFEHKTIEGDEELNALYNLIYLRAVASQMKAKLTDVTTVVINSSSNTDEFKAKASVITFDGFTKAYEEPVENENNDDDEMVEITEMPVPGQPLTLDSLLAKQSYLQPKSRYSEADLVKELERLGIGRPSTYASIIRNIKDVRKYISIGNAEGKKVDVISVTFKNGSFTETKGTLNIGKAKGKFIPNAICDSIMPFLTSNFTSIMDYGFTSSCEEGFDLIAQGKQGYFPMVSGFYSHLEKSICEADTASKDVAGKESKTIEVGQYEGKAVRVGSGNYGPYVMRDGKFYSFQISDYTKTTLAQAIEVIQQKTTAEKTAKQEKEANLLYSLGKYKIYKGQFGNYITDGKVNAPVPKWELDKLDSFTEAKCKEVVTNYIAYKKKNKK